MKIVAGVASIPSRERQLKRMVRSLLPQVSKINVALNDYDHVPEWLNRPNIEVFRTTNEKGDANKFHQIEGDLYLSCDDDIMYPRNYVFKTRTNAKTYHRDIITYHGRNITSFPVKSYYQADKVFYACRETLIGDVAVQFGGTGVMAFFPSEFCPTVEDFPTPNMADIHIAIAAKKAGKTIYCCRHRKGWFRVQDVPTTIYETHSLNDKVQTEYVNEVWLKLR